MDASVTAVILSGGRGSRFGEADKGLQPLRGRGMVEWVLERIDPQVDELLISANRNLEHYLAFGYPVLQDRVAGFAGPLAGVHAGLMEARCELVLSVPCDTPSLPGDLVHRLAKALQEAEADTAVARAAQRTHSVIFLCKASLLAHLTAFIDEGGRKCADWHARLEAVYVDFDDQPDAFRNINSLEELRAFEERGR